MGREISFTQKHFVNKTCHIMYLFLDPSDELETRITSAEKNIKGKNKCGEYPQEQRGASFAKF